MCNFGLLRRARELDLLDGLGAIGGDRTELPSV
jgi:hypothetical protein